MIIKKQKYKDYMINWIEEKRNFIKESTYANYSNLLYNYILPNVGDYKLKELNYKIIQDMILKLFSNGNGLSIKTIKDIVTLINSSLRSAFNDYKLKQFNLRFNYPKELSIRKMQLLSKEEQNILLDYILNNISEKNIGILISLLYGLRIGEICALKWCDIDFKSNLIHVNKTIQRIYIKQNKGSISKIIITVPKTKNAIRDIPISDKFAVILSKMQKDENNYIITGNNNYVEPRSYRNYFSNLLKKLNFKNFKFHSLRHTFATNCIELGTNYKTVSELLGHSNINTTLNLYVHPSFSEKKNCINNLYSSYNIDVNSSK